MRMMMRMNNARQPALTRQEAALYTALPRTGSQRSANLWMPQESSHFVSVNTTYASESTLAETRRGSIAGRAVLHTAGISMPGVSGMRRGCRRAQDRQAACDEVMYVLL